MTIFFFGLMALCSFIGFKNQQMIDSWVLHPDSIINRNQWYRLLSHGLIHADFTHLLFNGLSFYFAGQAVELVLYAYFEGLANVYFGILFLGALFFSSVPAVYRYRNQPNYRALGASGAVSAFLLVFVLFFPQQSLMSFFLPIPMPAWLYVIIYLGTEYYLAKKGGTGIAHDAHLYGALFGVLFAHLIDPLILKHFFVSIINSIL